MSTTATSILGELSKVSNKTGSTKQLSQDDFLKIMLKQLEQQDPSSPQDSNAMATQFAQFSMVNNLEDIKTSIDSMTTSSKLTQSLQAIGLVGKTADISSSDASLDPSLGMSGTVKVKDPTTNITLNISDNNGKILKQIKLGNVANAGDTVDFDWDGKLADGTKAEPGQYKISATGQVNNSNIALETFGGVKITGVNVSDNGALNVSLANNKTVNIKDVLKVF